MKLWNRYVLRQWFGAFFCVHAVATCLLIFEDIYKNLECYLKAHVAFRDLVRHYANLAISFYGIITPVAIFLGTLLAVGRMHRRNEIIAMRCAGVNILQITKSLILTAAVLGAINLAFEAAIAPHAVERIAEFMVAAEAKAGHGTAVNGVTFANRPAGRIWFFGEFDGLSATAKTVLVHCYGENGNETARIFAKSAIFDGDRNCWKFSNCTVTPFSEETNGPIRFDFFGEKYFEDFDEHPRIIGASMKKIRDLSFGETVDLIKYSRGIAAANGFSLKFHGTFANAVSCILVLLLAIPFAVSGIKVNPVVGAAKASIFFLLFLICGVIFSFAGRGGFVAPLTAAWAANAIAAVAIGKLLGGAM